jgi:adenine-specific DNA-methyltransferase
VVKGAGVDNIILHFIKGNSENTNPMDICRLKPEAKGIGSRVFDDIKSSKFTYARNIRKDYNELDPKGWIFSDERETAILNKIRGTALNNFCESYQGIITGCDEAFVIKDDQARELELDNKIMKPWIKNKNISQFKVSPSGEVIIYSDIITDEAAYSRELEHIRKKYEVLAKRRECRTGSRKWYQLQWGRKISLFEELKIVYPYKASKNRFAIDRGNCFSADVYAITVMDMFKESTSYEYLAGILNSSLYEFYIKSIAKKLGDNLYEYYPNKIMTLRVPEFISEIHELVVEDVPNLRNEIDMALNKYFGITYEEYEIIRSWCAE